MNAAVHTIEVMLTIKDNLHGDGNTGGGHYDYSFDPDLIHVAKRDTQIVYCLAKGNWPRFRMANLYTTDARDQLTGKEICKDGLELKVVHKNTHQQLTFVSLLVHDTEQDRRVNCDPQVTNDPEPVLG
jgi:hypothetical protein